MLKVERTLNIVTEQGTHTVSDLPTDIQQIVLYLDDWRERELNLSSELTMASSAIAHAKATLHQAIVKYEQEWLTESPEKLPSGPEETAE